MQKEFQPGGVSPSPQDQFLTPFFKRNRFLLENCNNGQGPFLEHVEKGHVPPMDILPEQIEKAETDSLYSYSLKDHCDKHIFLDMIGGTNDAREIPLLKQIIVAENNMELREKALEILNGCSHQQYWYSEEERAVLEIEKIRERSIFKPLFELGDRRSKLMLLEEMVQLGGSKELTFLNTLTALGDPLLIKQVARATAALQQRLQRNAIEELLQHVPEQVPNNPNVPAANGFGGLLEELNIAPYNPTAVMDSAFKIGELSVQTQAQPAEGDRFTTKK